MIIITKINIALTKIYTKLLNAKDILKSLTKHMKDHIKIMQDYQKMIIKMHIKQILKNILYRKILMNHMNRNIVKII